MAFLLQNSRIDHLVGPPFSPIQIDVLRLDLIHPVISGNKWFKLKFYLQNAKAAGKNTVLTFGGAYSNHIVATAAAAQAHHMKSIGIIRGEAPAALSHTLTAAKNLGMELFFVSRDEYKNKGIPADVHFHCCESDISIIPEGGYGPMGAAGAAEMLVQHTVSAYSHFVLAVGTGTTLAGLATAALPHQMVIGIPVLKNAFSLQQEIESLLPKGKHAAFRLFHDYHFGGYAKRTAGLIQFMNDVYRNHSLPTDFVYTAKALYAVFDLKARGYFKKNDKILFIHTGGLQGNTSLPKGTLIFDA